MRRFLFKYRISFDLAVFAATALLVDSLDVRCGYLRGAISINDAFPELCDFLSDDLLVLEEHQRLVKFFVAFGSFNGLVSWYLCSSCGMLGWSMVIRMSSCVNELCLSFS